MVLIGQILCIFLYQRITQGIGKGVSRPDMKDITDGKRWLMRKGAWSVGF